MRAFIISDREPLGSRVRQELTRQGIECPLTAAIPSAQLSGNKTGGEADLFVLVLPATAERGLEAVAELRARKQGALLAVGPATDAKFILRALRAGADDYCDEADLEAELIAWLRRWRMGPGANGRLGRVLAILASSGGSGSSTLAVNIAIALAQRNTGALLVDLKLETGDLATLLDLKPTYTLADLGRHAEQLDRTMLERALVAHATGVRLLAAPQGLADVGYVTSEEVHRVLALGRSLAPEIVVDLDHSFRPEQTVVLGEAETILLVLRLDFTCLRNTKRTLDYLQTRLGIPSDRVRLVVNRYGQSKEVPAGKAEQALGVKIAHFIPDDPRTINQANNQGLPAILHSPSAKVCRSIVQLAESLNGVPR